MEIFVLVFFVLFAHYVLFLLSVFKGLDNLAYAEKNKQPDRLHDDSKLISVIIPFRNESENILKSLASLEEQLYPKDKYEVIYVDDFSEDDSYEKICKAKKSDNIRVISVPVHSKEIGFKKRAIDYAIQNSKGEIIVLTDCDCEHGGSWLSTLLKEFSTESAFVSGPVGFRNDNTIFGKLQQLEFAGLVLAGAGLIGVGKPTICNAANLAFKKEVFSRVNGYDGNLNLSSGDDELLMQKIAGINEKIGFCFNKDAVVYTEPTKSVLDFYQQRKRWASKGLFYKSKLLVIKLILIYLFYLSLPFSLVLGITTAKIFLFVFVFSFTIKVLIEYLILTKAKALLFEKIEKPMFALAEVFHVPYILVAGFAGLFGNFTWKNRKLKR